MGNTDIHTKPPRCNKVLLVTISLLLLTISSYASPFQGIQITGTVLDKKLNSPLVGVTIIEKGTSNGAVTDFDGKFSLVVTDANSILEFSYVGFETQSVTVGSQTDFTIYLEESAVGLEQIIIVGYAEQKRVDVTGAISSIKAEEFNQGIVDAPEYLLQAKIPGVRVTSSSGEPGAATTLTIRGAGSLRSGDSPLYVIDGVPISNEATSPGSGNLSGSAIPTTAGSSNPLSFLNPSDIATVDVLKDASATAIYGSRGANGVVLITTKKGKSGKSKIDYNTYVGFSAIANELDVLTASNFNDTSGVDTDWQDEIYRTAISQNHNISYGTGNDRSSLRVSLGLLDQEGIIDRNKLKRYTGRVNSSVYALNENRMKLDFNLIASQTQNYSIPRADAADTSGELITNTLGALPTRPVFDQSGNFSSGPTNPVGLLNSWNDETITNRVLGNLSASYKILSNLKYQINFGVDLSNSKREQELIPNNLEGVAVDGTYSVADVQASNVLFENFATYNFDKDDHNFNFLVGYAYQEFSIEQNRSTYIGFILPNVSALDDPTNAPFLSGLPQGDNNTTTLESVFARVNYAFGNRLDVTASIRADGTSKFADGNKWGYFPAFAASYNLINPENSSKINYLKTRVGWGQTGNQNVPGNPTEDAFEFVQISETEVGLTKVAEGNPDLEWEVSNQFNVGVDFSMFDNRLYGNLDYFNKTNKKLILFVASEPPAVSGEWINLPGDIKNSGVELALGYKIIEQEDFNWSFDVNGTFISNDISLREGEEFVTGAISGPSLNGSFVQVIRDGEELGSFLLPTANPDGTVSEEKTIQGSGIPDFTYGFSTTANYKSLDFSLNFSGVAGNKIYNNTAHFLNNAGNNITRELAEETNQIPTGASDYFLEDGGFLRLNNATLGYTVNTSKVNFLEKLRLYITGQNIFVITKYEGYDPEVNTPTATNGILSYGVDFAAYPRARTFLIGLNASF